MVYSGDFGSLPVMARSQFQTASDELPQNWRSGPGWKNEQQYSDGVLIGNWAEQRHTFQIGPHQHNSTHRTDFRANSSHRPDVVIRRKALLKQDGLGPDHIFAHHGKRYANNMVSWYDEHYNGRWQENKNIPSQRTWKSHQLSWSPETSDHPLQGKSTNFGLLQKMEKRWRDQIADETHGDFKSTYGVSYLPLSRDALMTTRHTKSLQPIINANKLPIIAGGNTTEKLPAITKEL